MNCPHGRSTHAACSKTGCRETLFEHELGRGVVRVVKLFCRACDKGIGVRRGRGYGLNARTLREWQLTHPAPTHDTHWKLVAVDTGQEIFGRGAVPISPPSELQ
jgi:hypothetical protein